MPKISAKILLLVLCAALLAPHLAEARAGGGGSVGSRGSRTYQSMPSTPAAPIQRSVTPEPAPQPSSPSYAPQPSFAPSYGGGHPFLSGLAGGLIGGGLASMLFGHSGYGMDGISPAGSMFGGLLQILIFGGVAYLAYRWFTRRSGGFPPMAGMQDAPFNAAPAPLVTNMNAASTPLLPTPDDYQAFQQLLVNIQTAWGKADLTHLRQYLTPEMLSYFSEELSANSSRGQVNCIANVALTEGTLVEAWSEYALDYATVHFKWQAVDYMARLDRQPGDSDYVASGDPQNPVAAQEIWTFARAHNGGGHWLLSAIQQIG